MIRITRLPEEVTDSEETGGYAHAYIRMMSQPTVSRIGKQIKVVNVS